ncbi:hypothetical protein BGZ93_003405 [Podila epicladia]|nr:hypothetical protein BGZ92_004152 [Podila epicladia]KAG0100235.1 hypothetical protein BGZ93_003405 [Podila epicladia]
MSQPKAKRVSQTPSTSRSASSSSLNARPRRINVNLPKHSATAASFASPTTGELTLAEENDLQGRSRQELPTSSASESLLKMPDIATKPRSVDDILEIISATKSITCKLPPSRPTSFSNTKMVTDSIVPASPSSSPSLSLSSQRPGLDRRVSSNSSSSNTGSIDRSKPPSRTRSMNHGITRRVSFSTGHSPNITTSEDITKEQLAAKRSSSMNPKAASFTPTLPKPSVSDSSLIDDKASATFDRTPSKKQTKDTRLPSIDNKDTIINGLGISSPYALASSHQDSASFSANTYIGSPLYSSLAAMSTASPMLPSSTTPSAAPSTVDFDPEEFRINLMRQIADKLETDLDRHFSQMVSAASLSLPLSPNATHDNGSENSLSSTSAAKDPEEAISAITQLKKVLRHITVELERIKEKNQELRDENHKLELQRLEACHQVSRLQGFDLNNQFLLARVKELESSSGVGSPMEGDMGRADYLDTVSTSSRHNGEHFGSLQQVQQLMREVSSLTSERDALKIRAWELEKKPFAQQQVRSVHYVDLENERNRLLEELGAKTVATEELWNKNEALMVRAKEYEKRVWELESQCSSLEAECSSLPLLQADLAEMEARAVAADALVTKLQDMEGQLALVKSLQHRVQELETTNAELDHSNWDLSERLNIANNQHALLTKEFESFRSKDKDDRRLEFYATRNRELEALLQEQAKTSPSYKDEFDRISSEYEKVKIRLPQLEGQAKQVALLRSKTLQLEKQITTMEQLEPRLEEMQQLHERNLFLEGELGELELLRAREMELENELEETKTRLTQLECNKGRMPSLSGLKKLTRARSGSVAQHQLPFIPSTLPAPAPGQANEDEKEVNAESKVVTGSSPLRRGLSISSLDMVLSSTAGAMREFPQASGAPTASNWPSGRSSMSMSMATNRMSTISNASSNSSSVISNSSTIQNNKLTPSEEPESFIQPEVSNVAAC